MVRWFLLFLMIFAIGGAVVGAVTYLRVQGEKQAETAAVDTKPTNSAFVELDAINVPIKREDDALETRTYLFVLEARPGSTALIQQKRAKLRDTYTKYLAALAQRAGPENIENVSYLKGQLQSAANEVIGQNVVRDVLIRSMLSNVSG